MNKNNTIKPWDFNFKAFFMLIGFLFVALSLQAQNVLEKELTAERIDSIVIDGNQIFKITVVTSKTNQIKIVSTLDGEYQNEFQVEMRENNHTLYLHLEHLSFSEIPDDKRNAHKVIAATLQLEIPEERSLDIVSDIGSVDLNGTFNSLYIQLSRGRCYVEADTKTATINTLDGDIIVVTDNAAVTANSNHGKITVDEFYNAISTWKLKSINGNITVEKPD
ncbi:hypothetical protein ITJ86_07695 [Winogradskyella sp. F6397]|uniref:Adhesin domain-containing protein n=1 Tax=Winogradskyella marina TaxID=2785530 RepID=A0ABS0EH60_9FLAO|nr:hypothetical protein [Winogradskyella marina]MBF8149779.1 hypothetical protein [Winogradskyella marina]